MKQAGIYVNNIYCGVLTEDEGQLSILPGICDETHPQQLMIE